MKNQKGEAVSAVIIVVMAGMMIFGMLFMHGSHGDCGKRTRCEQQSECREKQSETRQFSYDNALDQKKSTHVDRLN